MLGLPLEKVPHFVHESGWDDFSTFAYEQGYSAVMLPGNYEFEADYLASGTTARGTSHMVVMNDGNLIHDPHPSSAGLAKVECVWLLARRATAQRMPHDEHSLFEACAKGYTSNVSFVRDGDGYEDMTAELLWHGWRLRAANRSHLTPTPTQPPAAVPEALRLAALMDAMDYADTRAAAVELRRLHALSAAAPSMAAYDYPAGEIVNGRTHIDRLESVYRFDCEAGPLALCDDWQGLKRCFEHLADSIGRTSPAASQAEQPGDGGLT